MPTDDPTADQVPDPLEAAHPNWSWTVDVSDDGLAVGDRVTFSKPLTEADIRRFAAASGDTNRLHLDPDFASQTRFGGPIAHGALVGGLVSAALARLPGVVIYLSQELSFVGPVPVGDEPTASVEIVDRLGSDRYRLETAVVGADDEPVIEGEATVLIDEPPAGAARG